MERSESIVELTKALSKAQAMMSGAVKGTSNPFFKSTYADLASVVEAIREPFASNGLSFSQSTRISDAQGIIVQTFLFHESGEWISGELFMPAVKLDPQAFGSAFTYGRRYGLQAIAGIPSVDDDCEGAMDRDKKQHTPTPPKKEYKPNDDAGPVYDTRSTKIQDEFIAQLQLELSSAKSREQAQQAGRMVWKRANELGLSSKVVEMVNHRYAELEMESKPAPPRKPRRPKKEDSPPPPEEDIAEEWSGNEPVETFVVCPRDEHGDKAPVNSFCNSKCDQREGCPAFD